MELTCVLGWSSKPWNPQFLMKGYSNLALEIPFSAKSSIFSCHTNIMESPIEIKEFPAQFPIVKASSFVWRCLEHVARAEHPTKGRHGVMRTPLNPEPSEPSWALSNRSEPLGAQVCYSYKQLVLSGDARDMLHQLNPSSTIDLE